MKQINIIISVLILFTTFLWFYYQENVLKEVSKEYIGILIFFFATITGVFISRQGKRYNLVVRALTDFNGNLSFQYRGMENIDEKYQEKIGLIIKKHFSYFKDDKYSWDWFMKVKTTTLTDINRLHMEIIKDGLELNKLQSHFINRSQASLLDMHKIRKNLVPLMKENIPTINWIIIWLLAAGLFISIVSFNSQFNFSESLLKALFITSIFSVMLTLFKMNKLNFYEEMPGESSAQDVLDIIAGKK